MIDEAGMINKDDFTQLAKDTHLLDFESTMGTTSPMALLSPRKTRKQPQTPKKGQNKNTEDNPDEKVMMLESEGGEDCRWKKSAVADGHYYSRVCTRVTLLLAPITHSRNFVAHMSV